MQYTFSPPKVPALQLADTQSSVPVNRIFCVGRNFVEHAKEMGFTGREPPFFFMKPASALVASVDEQAVKIAYPTLTEDLHPEVELVVALGIGGVSIAPRDAVNHIIGYAVGLDMTRRDLQNEMKKQARPWCIGKAFEQSAPVGVMLPAADFIIAEETSIQLDVNGETRQSGQLGQMIWNVAEIISHLSHAWELRPGDLIFCGTPEGVGPVIKGDHLFAKIAGLPDLRVDIV